MAEQAKAKPQAEVKPLSNMPEDEVARLVLAVREALTDSMVERLAVTGGNALEVVDRLNDEATRDAVHTLLNRLTELHRIGALDTLFDVVAFVHAAKSASTDNIVERLFGFAEQMVNTMGSDNLARLAEGGAGALEDAVRDTADVRPSGGIFSTISMLSKPESQRSLMFLLSFADNLQKRCCD
jgi:uncharacterized protein YjgD (DUF1641 family)